MEFLNQNAGALNALFSGVVALSTIVYAILTWKLVTETRRIRHAQTEPKVIIKYRTHEEWASLIDIVVKNIGPGPASDIRFMISPNTSGEATQEIVNELTKRNFIQSGISFLAPSQEISSFLLNVRDNFEDKMAAVIIMNVTFKSEIGTAYSGEYRLDLSELRGIVEIGEAPPFKIAKTVEALAKSIDRIANGSSRIKVNVYSAIDRDK